MILDFINKLILRIEKGLEKPFFDFWLKLLEWLLALGVLAYAQKITDSAFVLVVYALSVGIFTVYLGDAIGNGLSFLDKESLFSFQTKRFVLYIIAFAFSILITIGTKEIVYVLSSVQDLEKAEQQSSLKRIEESLERFESIE